MISQPHPHPQLSFQSLPSRPRPQPRPIPTSTPPHQPSPAFPQSSSSSSSLPRSWTNPPRPPSSSSSSSNSSPIPLCACGQPASQRTVVKPGPNMGRPFFICSKPREQQCSFFQWADQPPATPTPPSSHVPANSFPPSSTTGKPPPSVSVICDCGETAALRRVAKEGANQGRSFYCCPRPREQQCNFFLWADETPTNGNTTLFKGNSGREGGRNELSCFQCGKKGHLANACPAANTTKQRKRQPKKTGGRKTTRKAKAPPNSNMVMDYAVDTGNDFQMDTGIDYGDFDMDEFQNITWEM